MKKRKIGVALSLVLAAGTLLGACGKATDNTKKGTTGGDKKAFSVGMVTDVGGIDDKSFNQSAWKGLQEFGKDNNMKKGTGGYDYLQSQSDADYATNLNTLTHQNFDLIYGIGFMMSKDVDKIAKQQPKNHYAIVDDVVNEPNVASIMFKENESSFLAGVAAGLTTKSNKIGFIGGMESAVIERFESGFTAGVKAANPNANVDVQYAASFTDAAKGQAIASRMYSTGEDVIFAAAGATGNGLFKEARDRKAKNPDQNFWAIGVDSDQSAEGVVTAGGKQTNVVITSSMKRVDNAVKDLSTKAMNGNFPGGKTTTYGLAEDGVGIAPINNDDPAKAAIDKAVSDWSAKIKSGSLKVPATRAELKTFSVK
ncbi:BMP family lipoprotein [Neobacillus massiliamazoniensis]|uniref:ABC transporter ATP-binding protein n=1 Tax=Neobacillus massiliamazoniensis TaxID=1499688 RepID=A0A0U1NQY7_9BACI|nr:BMP family ABC transporter substrate-binding protein [Neobacillus massiliamazoniensis]CRK80461.1 ABC transporter ATP-binding protein [Neobacillus massiliamazoniensis]